MLGIEARGNDQIALEGCKIGEHLFVFVAVALAVIRQVLRIPAMMAR